MTDSTITGDEEADEALERIARLEADGLSKRWSEP
jgi:hypothetical protein